MTESENLASNPPEELTSVPSTESDNAAIIAVKNYTLASFAPALLPMPLVDLTALTGIQLKMLHRLCEIYGVNFTNEMARASIISLVGSVLPVLAAPMLASVVKFIPIVGQVSGVASMLVFSAAATHALGMVFVRHFEQGGDLSNFEATTAKAYFKEEFEKGKQIALELRDKANETVQKVQQMATSPATSPTTGDSSAPNSSSSGTA
jgi:uncharacterized protein (DUF697 family)